MTVFSMVRYLERLADRMTNICEDVIYLAQGEIVRHREASILDDRPEQGPGSGS